jgi:hypothetical protein
MGGRSDTVVRLDLSPRDLPRSPIPLIAIPKPCFAQDHGSLMVRVDLKVPASRYRYSGITMAVGSEGLAPLGD